MPSYVNEKSAQKCKNCIYALDNTITYTLRSFFSIFQPRCKYALISLQAITAHGKTFFKILLFYFTLSISFAPNFQINYYFFQFMTTYWLTGDYYLNNVLTDIANLVLCIFWLAYVYYNYCCGNALTWLKILPFYEFVSNSLGLKNCDILHDTTR